VANPKAPAPARPVQARLSPWTLAIATVLAGLVAPPLFFLLKTSLYTTEPDGSFGVFSLENYAGLIEDGHLGGDLVNSLIFAFGSAFLAISGGFLQAWIVERTNSPFTRYVFLVSIISLGIPHVLYTGAWVLVLGKSGPVNAILMMMTGAAQPVFDVYSMTGMILIEGMLWMPLAFLLLCNVFRNMDGSFEDAALMSGASIFQALVRITLPLALPGLLALFLLIFIRAFEAFDIPAIIGSVGDVTVLSTQIFASIRKELPSNFGQAGAFAMTLMSIVILLLLLQRRILAKGERFQTVTGKGYRPRVIQLGAWRHVFGAALILLTIALLAVPLGMIMLISLVPFYDGMNAAMFSRVTFANYDLAFANPHFRTAVFNTLIYGFGAATMVTLLTTGSAWLSARRRRGSFILEQLTSVPLAFPAIVLGVAFMQTFLNMPFMIYGTLASLIIAATMQYLPYGMRFSHAGAMQIHLELEEAAAGAGANRFQIFRKIVLPLLLPSVLMSWLFVVLLCVRGVALPILLASPNSQVVSVMLYDLWVNGQVNELAAFGVIWSSMMIGVGTCLYLLSRKSGVSF
jgi:iron(III) transport system permease protein